jgi:PAS domain S-box-containing protein
VVAPFLGSHQFGVTIMEITHTPTHEFDTDSPSVLYVGGSETARALDSLGPTVRYHEPPDPAAALSLVGQVDCVVAEYDLGRTTALDLFDAVRERSAHLPFVLVTTGDETLGESHDESASDHAAVVREAFRRGVTGHVVRGSGATYATALRDRIEVAVEHARAERERLRARTAVDTRREPVAVVDDDGQFCYVNRAYCETFDRREDALLDEPLSVVFPEGVTERLRRAAADATDEPQWCEGCVGLRGDGTARCCRVVVSPLPDGGFSLLVASDRDRVSLGDAE